MNESSQETKEVFTEDEIKELDREWGNFNAQDIENAVACHDQQEDKQGNMCTTDTQEAIDKTEFWMWRKPQYWTLEE